MVSPVRFFWTAGIEPWTRELPVVEASVKGPSVKASAVGMTSVTLAIRRDTLSATLVTSWSINPGESKTFDTSDTSVASGSKGAALVPKATADGFLPLFCFLVAGSLAVEAASLVEH